MQSKTVEILQSRDFSEAPLNNSNFGMTTNTKSFLVSNIITNLLLLVQSNYPFTSPNNVPKNLVS